MNCPTADHTAPDIESMVAPPSAQPLDPIPTPIPETKNFPHIDEVPEGCIVLDEPTEDSFGYPVDMEQVTYATRQLADGTSVDMPLWVFTPGTDNMPEGQIPEVAGR